MFTKKFAKNCAVLVLSAFGVLGIASCGTENKDENNGGTTPETNLPEVKEYNVQFMVQDENNAWTVLIGKKVVNEKVELPSAPAKKYYTFAGWYTTEALTEEFNENSVKAETKAYAKYIPQEVKVHINDDEVVTKNLVDVVNATYNPGEGLEFDGWYKDAAYSVQWNGTDEVKDLYATSVALITFNNGYEDVYTMPVKPGTVITNPAETEVDGKEAGTKSTLEAESIVKDYMDLKDIHYVNEDGTAYDFTQPINKSTTINVEWASKGLTSRITKSDTSDGYYLNFELMSMEVVDNAPALSYPGKLTNSEGQVVDIEGVLAASGTDLILPTTTKKVIFGEGIKFIKGFNGPTGNVVEEIELPDSLRILDNSFSNMPNLKGATLNEGLEILIGSFWNNGIDENGENFRNVLRADAYEFDINVPASVKNLSMVPSNLTFAENSAFVKDGDIIYKKVGEEKTLIADNANLTSKTIVVPEGFTSIQVGTYYNVRFDYLILPASLKTVSYNEKWVDYKYYHHNGQYDNFLTNIIDNGDGTIDNTEVSPASYSITNTANGYYNMSPLGTPFDHDGGGFIVFPEAKMPTTLDKYAIVGGVTGYEVRNGKFAPITDERLAGKTICKDEVQNIYVTLEHFMYSDMAGGLYDNATAIIPTKDSFTIDEIVAELKKQNSKVAEKITTALAGKEIKIFSNNKEITANDIKREMFLSLDIVEPAA